MNRIDILSQKIKTIYEEKDPNRSEWADWLYESHVFLVANKAKALAVKYGASEELAQAAGMLHDIADARMSRFDERHEQESLVMARNLMIESGFSPDEVRIAVDDAIAMHGCKNMQLPQTLEGKVMATADAVVHLTSDFYDFAKAAMSKTETEAEIKTWATKKIERDFYEKIFFEEVKSEVRDDYNRIVKLFE